MTNPAADEPSDYNTQIIKEFRANQGRVGGMWTGTTLTSSTTSAPSPGSSGSPRWPAPPRGEGRFAIWAANGGSPTHPNWYYNLKAHPKIIAEVGAKTFTVLARELNDTARAERNDLCKRG